MTRRHSRAWHEQHDAALAEAAAIKAERAAALAFPQSVTLTGDAYTLFDTSPRCGTLMPMPLFDPQRWVDRTEDAPDDKRLRRERRGARFHQTGNLDD